MLTVSENNRVLKARIKEIVTSSPQLNYVLIDGDRTLSPVDSTHYFFESLGLNYLELKSIFQRYGYSFQGFLSAAEFYSNIPHEDYEEHCFAASRKVEIYSEFLEFILNCMPMSRVIVITAGLQKIWENVLAKYSISGKVDLIGGNHFHFDDYIIDQASKGFIIDQLHIQGKRTWAFGDSLVDYDMLTKANKGHLVINNKGNKDILPLLSGKDQISQVSFNGLVHPNLKKKTLSEILSEIISIPKR